MEYTILLIVEVLAAIGLVGLVLLQQGKGAEMGASFGAGASQTIFGSSGSGNFMTRLTAIFATTFFLACLGLAFLANREQAGHEDMEVDFSSVTEVKAPTLGELPAVPVSEVEGDVDGVSQLPPAVSDAQATATTADTTDAKEGLVTDKPEPAAEEDGD